MSRIRIWAPVIAVVATAVLAGCGSSGGSPAVSGSAASIAARMKTALAHATSVHMSGRVTNSGQTGFLDLSLSHNGDFAGTVRIGGSTMQITSIGKHTYINFDRGFVKIAHIPAALCSVMCGKYVEMSGAQAASFAGNFSMTKLMGQLTRKIPHLTKGGTTTVNGQKALALHSSNGTTVYVAATGKTPYPLEVVSTKSNNSGRVYLSQWNAVPAFSPPPASKVVKLSQVLHG